MNRTSQPGTPSGYPPRYSVFAEPNGFRVEGRDRRPAFVRLAPGNMAFLIAGEPEAFNGYDEEGGYFTNAEGYSCSLYGYHRLLETLAALVMQGWERPSQPPNEWSGIGGWALGRTKRALHFRGVYQEWQRLLGLVPETQRALSKAVFAATFDARRLGCETWPDLLRYPYLVRDILSFRAAASACHYATRLIEAVGEAVTWQRERASETALILPEGIGERCIAYLERKARLEREMLSRSVNCLAIGVSLEREQRALRQEVLALLAQDWKALYSSNGTAGRALCRTLMNLPGGITGGMLCNFPLVESFLEKPPTDRLVLLAFLLFGRTLQCGVSLSSYWEGHIYARAQREDILAALQHLSAHLHRPLRPRRDGVAELVQYLADYCSQCRVEGIPPHTGNLTGLTKKAIRWHRQWQAEYEERWRLAQEAAEQRAQELLEDPTPTALPSLPVPDNPALSFLESIGAIHREGKSMGHCIGSLADQAVSGSCYLFHVEYQGECASVQVSRFGEVIQSYGPKNMINSASDYGRRVLGRWGGSLRKAARMSQERS
jgi:hypothetical protein